MSSPSGLHDLVVVRLDQPDLSCTVASSALSLKHGSKFIMCEPLLPGVSGTNHGARQVHVAHTEEFQTDMCGGGGGGGGGGLHLE